MDYFLVGGVFEAHMNLFCFNFDFILLGCFSCGYLWIRPRFCGREIVKSVYQNSSWFSRVLL